MQYSKDTRLEFFLQAKIQYIVKPLDGDIVQINTRILFTVLCESIRMNIKNTEKEK